VTKLNQILAIEKSRKSEANSTLDKAYKLVQKPAIFEGLTRDYTPKYEGESADVFPPERQPVQANVPWLVDQVSETLSKWFDITAVKDWTNLEATSDVVVEGELFLTSVPVTYLLFLDKQLTDLHTFVSKFPLLDPAVKWEWDDTTDGYVSSTPIETLKTKKVPRSHVLYEATEEHPAQVEAYTEDQIIGTWSALRFSGALRAADREEVLDRISGLRDAVRFAREHANEKEVEEVSVGGKLIDYIFSPLQDLD